MFFRSFVPEIAELLAILLLREPLESFQEALSGLCSLLAFHPVGGSVPVRFHRKGASSEDALQPCRRCNHQKVGQGEHQGGHHPAHEVRACKPSIVKGPRSGREQQETDTEEPQRTEQTSGDRLLFPEKFV